MPGTELREMGTTAQFAPRIKRAAGVLSNSRNVVMVPDTNISTANGDDVTGVGKIYIYTSTTAGDAPWTVKAYTPGTAAMSATRKFVGSMAIGTGTVANNLYIVYTGTDNSLRLITLSSYNGSTDWTVTAEQTIVVGNAVTNRYRAIDIDVTSSGNVGVIVYEATASSGQGCTTKVYIRNNDGTTWRLAHNIPMMGSSFIKDGGEDVSISFDSAGVVSNVIKFAIYFTWTATTSDNGDNVRNLTYNVSTGTDNSATNVGSWYTTLNRYQASGSRRGWLFKIHAGNWLLATSVGTSVPYFQGIKLAHGTFGSGAAIVVNKIAATGTQPAIYAVSRKFIMLTDANKYAQVTATYSDGSLLFVYSGVGNITARAVRALVMTWTSESSKVCSYKDTEGRPWDQNYSSDDGVIGVYGGMNFIPNSTLNDYPVLVIYGSFGNSVSNVENVLERRARVVSEDLPVVPTMTSPLGNTVPNNRPLLQAIVKGSTPYSNVRMKTEWQLARDAAFTVDVRTISESDSAFSFYNSSNGVTLPIRTVARQLVQAEALYSGTWFIRARTKEEFFGTSAWTSAPTDSFNVSHPPVALPKAPTTGSVRQYGTGDVTFTWAFTDTESTDVQSAYQLVIERQDTGATVSDSGKVLSSVKSVVVNLAVGLTDVPLQWKVRLWDSDDIVGVYSNPLLFTLASPPTTSMTLPVDSSVVTTALPTFQWTYASAGAYDQKAYRVIVYDTVPSPDEIVADSGWIFESTTSHQFGTNILENLGSYRAEIYVMDVVGMQGTDSNVFTADWIEPVLGTVTVATDAFKHTITWDDTDVDTDFVSWRLYRKYMVPAILEIDVDDTANTWVLISEQDLEDSVPVYNPGMNSTFETGITGWSSTSGTPSSSSAQFHEGSKSLRLVPDGVSSDAGVDCNTIMPTAPGRLVSMSAWIRPDTTNKSIRVFIHWRQSNGTYIGNDLVDFTVTAAGQWQKIEFSAVAPALAFQSFVAVTLTGTPAVGDAFYLDEVQQWSQSYEYRDYAAPLNKEVRYLLVQLVDRFGSLIESNLGAGTPATLTGDRYFFVPEVPIGSIASFEAANITSDSFTDEVEQETLHVIGRGRQVQVGDDLGYTGTLTVKLRNPDTVRRDREFLELLASDKVGNLWIKSPFGDVLYVRLGNIQTARQAGMGSADIVDLTVPYLVVFQESQVTRVV